jgi:WD40 repeat protein
MMRVQDLCVTMVLIGVAFPAGVAHAQAPAQATDEAALLATARTNQGHYVYSIAFAPNGKTVAAGTTDGTIYMWEAATGKEIGSIAGNKSFIIRQVIAFSPDGRTLAACAPDGALCLWEAFSGKQRFRLGAPAQQGVPSVAFSPNGKLVAATNPVYQGRARVWEAETGKELVQLQGSLHVIYHIAFTRDSKALVGTGYSKKDFENVAGVHVWDAATGKYLRAVFAEASGNSFASFALSPDGKTAAVGWSSHALNLWDVASGQRLHQLERHGNQVLAVAFSRDGKLLASGCEDGKVRLFEVATGRTLAVFAAKQSYVCGVAFSPDGKRLASGGMDAITSSQLSDAFGSACIYDLTSLFPGAGEKAVTLTAKELAALYSDLQGDQERRAFRAIFTLTQAPQQTVALLTSQLKPAVVPPAEAKQLAQWIGGLGSDQKAVRDHAAAELERLGQEAEPAMRNALAANPATEVRKHLEWLIGELRGLEPTPQMRLARRAAEVLERIATPEARKLLAELAQEAPEAWLTHEARLSLEHLIQAQPEPKGKTEPAGVPLELRLLAKNDTYVLDLGGKTPEEFRKLAESGGPGVAAPEVDLVLEFRNTGDKEIKFLVGGTNPDIPLLLKLEGAGAVNVTLRALLSAMVSQPPQQVALAPGKTYTLPVKSLRTNNLGREGSASFWTQPGEYQLTATYHTAVSPMPKDAKESPRVKGFGMVTVTSSPLKLKVVEAKK